jgi:hypothetical protein
MVKLAIILLGYFLGGMVAAALVQLINWLRSKW